MDPSVAGSPAPDGPTGRDAAHAAEPTAPESVRVGTFHPESDDAALPDEVISIQREIEALKAFLAKYPAPIPPPVAELPRRGDGESAASDAAAYASQDDDPVRADADRAGAVRAGAVRADAVRADTVRWLLGTRRRQVAVAIGLAAILLVAVPRLPFFTTAGKETSSGTLSVSTNPTALSVFIDGTRRGVTPLTVDLRPGEHMMELVTGSERRRIPFTIKAGGQVSHFIELAPVHLELSKRPASGQGSVAATAGSRSSASSPGDSLASTGSTGRAPATRLAAGWISITAPSEVQVRENGRLLGTSRIDRIMLPAGRHQLEFVNEPLGYRAIQTVDVIPEQRVPVRLRWPEGSVALNALPWAEVFVDGRSVGETPIGNLALPIGVHEIVFRHPELGERRASVTVTVGKRATLGVDFGVK